MSFKTPLLSSSSTSSNLNPSTNQNSNQSTSMVSLSIRSEIQRFESVHPSIYSIYELIEHIGDNNLQLANAIREHVVNIEDSFVNSQEWTLSRSVEEIRIGILGSTNSQKSTLVHRYLTNQYIEDNSPEGGRFKKELIFNNKPYMLLLRDEGSHPELQFTHWLDVLILVANSLETVKTCYSYVSRLASYKSLNEIPIVLISVSEDSGYANEFKKIPHNVYTNVDVVTGRNIEAAFNSAVNLIKPMIQTPSTPRKLFQNSQTKSRRQSNIFNRTESQISTQSDAELGSGRVIPLKQGYLLKKSKNDKLKKWKKKYVILTKDFKFKYYENINNYMENGNPKIIDLKHSNVKRHLKNHFAINTLLKVYEFECSNSQERDSWVEIIEQQIMNSLQCNYQIKGVNNLTEISNILKLHGNDHCADCQCHINDSFWISSNFGTIICIACSGIHRNLGSHISRVRSLQLDEISPVTLKILENISGNTSANELIYENQLKCKQISPTSSMEEKSIFIRRKYEKLEFLPVATKDIFDTLKDADFKSYLPALFKISFNNHNLFQDLIYCIAIDLQNPVFLQELVWAGWDDMDSKTKQTVKTKINKAISDNMITEPNVKFIIQCL